MPDNLSVPQEVPVRPIAIEKLKITKPSPELLQTIRDAKIESLYGLLEDDSWQQFLTNAIVAEFDISAK